MADETERKAARENYLRAMEYGDIQGHLHFQFALDRLSAIPCPVEYPSVSSQVEAAINELKGKSAAKDIALHGHFLWKGQKYPEAEARFNDAINADGNSVEVRLIVGEYYKWKRDYETAKEHLSIANDRCSGDPNVMVYFGEACLLAGDRENAERIFEPLLTSPSRDSWNPSTTALVGWYIMNVKTRWGNATELFESIRDEANWKCSLLFGEWSRRVGDYRSAISAFVDCLRLCPSDFWARVRLIYCYWKCGAVDECLKEYKIIVQQHECADTLLCYADLLRISGKDFGKAQEMFEKSQKLIGDEPWEWITVRIEYCKLGAKGQRVTMEDFYLEGEILDKMSSAVSQHKADWNEWYKADLKIVAGIAVAMRCGYSYEFEDGDESEWGMDANFLNPDFQGHPVYPALKAFGLMSICAEKSSTDIILILKKALDMEPSDATNWLNLAKAHIINDEFDEGIYHYRVALTIARSGNDLPFLKELLIYGCKIHFHFNLWDCFDDSLPMLEHDQEFLVWHAFVKCDETCIDEASEILFMAADLMDQAPVELRYYACLVRGRIDLIKGDGANALMNAEKLISAAFPGYGESHPEGYALAARAHMLLNNVEDCKTNITLAMNKLNTLSGYPRLIHWVFAQALCCYVEMKEFEHAKKLYDRWSNGGSKSGHVYDYQVWCYAGMMFSNMDEEKQDEALRHFGHACRVNRRHYLARWQLGLFFKNKKNDPESAKKCFVNALACTENNTAGPSLDAVAQQIRKDLESC